MQENSNMELHQLFIIYAMYNEQSNNVLLSNVSSGMNEQDKREQNRNVNGNVQQRNSV